MHQRPVKGDVCLVIIPNSCVTSILAVRAFHLTTAAELVTNGVRPWTLLLRDYSPPCSHCTLPFSSVFSGLFDVALV